MLLNRNPAPFPPPDTERLHGLVRAHWSLALCVVCGHEQPRGEHNRATCPGCGAQLRIFPLYRDLRRAMSRRFSGTTARKYDEHPEPSR